MLTEPRPRQKGNFEKVSGSKDLSEIVYDGLTTGVPPGTVVTTLIGDRPVVCVRKDAAGAWPKLSKQRFTEHLALIAEPIDGKLWVLFDLPLARKLFMDEHPDAEPLPTDPNARWKR